MTDRDRLELMANSTALLVRHEPFGALRYAIDAASPDLTGRLWVSLLHASALRAGENQRGRREAARLGASVLAAVHALPQTPATEFVRLRAALLVDDPELAARAADAVLGSGRVLSWPVEAQALLALDDAGRPVATRPDVSDGARTLFTFRDRDYETGLIRGTIGRWDALASRLLRGWLLRGIDARHCLSRLAGASAVLLARPVPSERRDRSLRAALDLLPLTMVAKALVDVEARQHNDADVWLAAALASLRRAGSLGCPVLPPGFAEVARILVDLTEGVGLSDPQLNESMTVIQQAGL